MSRRSSSLTRRDLLRTTGVYGLGASSLGFSLGVPLPAAAAPAIEPWNRFPRMVQEYFVDRVREIEQRSIKRKTRLNNKAEAEAYVREVQAKIRQAFGPMPERTPLKPRITGVVERDAYKIEKLIFESRPGFLVTANLYLPKGRSGRLPGVVGTCGHSANGKAAGAYQSFCQGLAKMGYVVLIYDPIGQGERLQYTDADLKPRVGIGTREHLYAGNQQFWSASSLGHGAHGTAFARSTIF